MAKLVMGIGSSHSPILLMEPPAWRARGLADDRIRHHLYDFDGRRVQYEDLVVKLSDSMVKELDDELMLERHRANNAAMARVSEILLEADPDVVIIIGDDHKEVYHDENLPALAIYSGETFPYKPQGIMRWRYADDLKTDLWYPQEEQSYPVASEFARRLIGDLCHLGFDPAHSAVYAPEQGMSHAFGYVYHQIMTKKIFPIIPVTLNTYFPPNQVTPRRAYQIGQAIRQAVESWPEDLRVVVMSTGGLSHFVVDEAFDRMFLKLMADGGIEGHAALPLEKLQSGNSELRCWSLLAGAVEGKSMTLIDYQPCYRSFAGTGCGTAFAYWE